MLAVVDLWTVDLGEAEESSCNAFSQGGQYKEVPTERETERERERERKFDTPAEQRRGRLFNYDNEVQPSALSLSLSLSRLFLTFQDDDFCVRGEIYFAAATATTF